MKPELKCPWCGSNFGNKRDLESHARNHYAKAVASQEQECFVEVSCDCENTVT
jgi:hypothetical protein